MTAPKSYGDTPLPGLGTPLPPNAGNVERSARETIAELSQLGYVKPHHAVVCAMILAGAQSIDKGAATGRASSVALAMKEVREAFQLLIPEDAPTSGNASWDALVAEFHAAADR